MRALGFRINHVASCHLVTDAGPPPPTMEEYDFLLLYANLSSFHFSDFSLVFFCIFSLRKICLYVNTVLPFWMCLHGCPFGFHQKKNEKKTNNASKATHTQPHIIFNGYFATGCHFDADKRPCFFTLGNYLWEVGKIPGIFCSIIL